MDHPIDLSTRSTTQIDLWMSYQHEIEMVINLKLAKALDLIVPLVLLGPADEMIE